MRLKILKPLMLVVALGAIPLVAFASSHREAPFITLHPKVDATDFYMFMSYEPDRAGYVTLAANYVPVQAPWGGPNYYTLNPNAVYDINIDNNGDAIADIVFRFDPATEFKHLAVPAGTGETAVPLINIGAITASDQSALNRIETYTVTVYNGDPRTTEGDMLASTSDGSTTFTKPVSNIGHKSLPDYMAYASQYVYEVAIPGCSEPGRVFVGQRKDPFVVNLGELFDLVNLNPVGPRDGAHNTLHTSNVTELALEVPAACLTQSAEQPIIGGWTTASLRQARVLNPAPTGEGTAQVVGGAYTQVSRLGMPLVNEVVIGLPDKDRFNASQPADDVQFLDYVTQPSLPVLLNVLFGDAAKVPDTPRNDLVAVFLTGIAGLNQPADVAPSEQLRLNTSIPPTPPAAQNDLGVLGGDLAGFPNGRRPYDDVVDIALRVVEGVLCGYNETMNCGDMIGDPNMGAPYTDQTRAAGATAATAVVTGNEYPTDVYLDHFPYFLPPLPGSPNGENGIPAD
ncbi:MAG: DUF4331 domain-containing protein [Gammaproteobacteria bacterium]|nr:DUF4331 domain-containing protein [Gammaproteobacteria bacterium]